MDELNEKSPAGWGGTTSAMMKHHKKEIDNPWALAYWMKKRDFKSHYKNDPKGTKSKKEPEKKEKYKDDKKDESLGFSDWLDRRETQNEVIGEKGLSELRAAIMGNLPWHLEMMDEDQLRGFAHAVEQYVSSLRQDPEYMARIKQRHGAIEAPSRGYAHGG